MRRFLRRVQQSVFGRPSPAPVPQESTVAELLDGRLAVLRTSNAEHLASKLFHDSFRVAFPVPRDHCGLPIPTPPHAWSQFVALYRWPDGNVETVGFCNWIRYGDVYLEGGLCVRPGFYLRMPRDDYLACRDRGGVAQIIMEAAATQLDDCAAWFGYVGDRKSSIVTRRVGYEPTEHQHLIVKWFRSVDARARAELIASVARIGPF
jgi:hypothetical protein